MRMRQVLIAFFSTLTMVASVPAQMLSPDYGTFGAPMSNFLSSSYLTQQVMNDALFKRNIGSGVAGAKPAALTFNDASRPPTMPRKLAEAYPAAKRGEVERVFNAVLMDLYPKLVQFYGLPHNDLAGAVATFIAGSYQAYRNNIEDEMFKTLPNQIRGALAANANIAGAPDAAKQEMYEQMAILGMFMLGVQEALKKTPDAQISANMKKAGEDYLRTFLGVDPRFVHITNAGMTLDEIADATAAPRGAPFREASQSALSSAALRQANDIETVGFFSKIGFGYGGMMTFNPTPIILFKSGEALYDMEALKFAGGLAAHKAAHPKDWTTWRRAGQAIEVGGDKGWEKITYTKTMDRLPQGFRLAGDYQRTGGGGNLAVGGTAAVLVWSNLSFDRAGNFTSGGGSGSTSSEESAGSKTSVVTSGHAPNEYGQYSIDGYSLTLNYADGRVEQRMIVTDVADPGVIWLDGDGYTSSRN